MVGFKNMLKSFVSDMILVFKIRNKPELLSDEWDTLLNLLWSFIRSEEPAAPVHQQHRAAHHGALLSPTAILLHLQRWPLCRVPPSQLWAGDPNHSRSW